ncbi:pyridoxamine 5'-phosphate oxidase family protein [Gordonia sp. X0973]|uniref:pyridoxamine 5'-phosphate oxidase family protein n=1 Tax=Gordonia sp. X0973 TaxID=2742602 RepID=UPI0013EC4D3D|nr:pyridoxamine 5'-phosphate oxidase family protein [Gordonia sp. X0973]QKT07320.1 pyridoxamine 5'-phosphate oxidase family protein [Gordonia sp. X0973]
MRSTTYCNLVTTGPAGPTARLVQPFPADDELVVHLGTDPTSRKARQIRADDNVLLVYQRDRDRACVVAYCRARIQEDPATARRYFMPSWRAFWPDGPGDDFVVIRCEPYALEIWDARRGITPPPFGRRCARLEYRDDGVWELDDV